MSVNKEIDMKIWQSIMDYNGTPSYSDCIEITSKEIIKYACDWLKQTQMKPTYFDVDFLQKEWYLDRDRLVRDFRKAMEDNV